MYTNKEWLEITLQLFIAFLILRYVDFLVDNVVLNIVLLFVRFLVIMAFVGLFIERLRPASARWLRFFLLVKPPSSS